MVYPSERKNPLPGTFEAIGEKLVSAMVVWGSIVRPYRRVHTTLASRAHPLERRTGRHNSKFGRQACADVDGPDWIMASNGETHFTIPTPLRAQGVVVAACCSS